MHTIVPFQMMLKVTDILLHFQGQTLEARITMVLENRIRKEVREEKWTQPIMIEVTVIVIGVREIDANVFPLILLHSDLVMATLIRVMKVDIQEDNIHIEKEVIGQLCGTLVVGGRHH